jgi:hypothetical protein
MSAIQFPVSVQKAGEDELVVSSAEELKQAQALGYHLPYPKVLYRGKIDPKAAHDICEDTITVHDSEEEADARKDGYGDLPKASKDKKSSKKAEKPEDEK